MRDASHRLPRGVWYHALARASHRSSVFACPDVGLVLWSSPFLFLGLHLLIKEWSAEGLVFVSSV
jgi:hypothetical protein